MQPALSIVVPCYKSGPQLPALVAEVEKAMESFPGGYELILVNDGSPDVAAGAEATWPSICALQASHANVVGIDLLKNFGQHSATLAGISQSRGDIVLTIDDDLQYKPADIPILLEALQKGADLVYGVYSDTNHGMFRGFAALLVRGVIYFAGKSNYARATSFRCFRGEFRQLLGNVYGRTVCIDSQLVSLTKNVVTVPVQRTAREVGESGYTLSSLLGVAFDFILSDDAVLVRLIWVVATVFFDVGLIILLLRLFNLNTNDLMAIFGVVMIFTAVQLFFLGGLIVFNTRLMYSASRRPLFAIRQVRAPEVN